MDRIRNVTVRPQRRDVTKKKKMKKNKKKNKKEKRKRCSSNVHGESISALVVSVLDSSSVHDPNVVTFTVTLSRSAVSVGT